MSEADEKDPEGIQAPATGDPLGGTGGDIGGGPTGDVRNSPEIIEDGGVSMTVVAAAAGSFLVGLMVGWALWN